jgi:hypothetical protein
MSAIVDAERPFPGKPQVSLVDEPGGLQRVIRAALPEVMAGQALQLIINERQDRLKRLAVAISPVQKQFADWARRLWGHLLGLGSPLVRGICLRILKTTPHFQPGFVQSSPKSQELVVPKQARRLANWRFFDSVSSSFLIFRFIE